MARTINMTASYFVTGNIDEKKRTRWVAAIPTAPDVKDLDDEELGRLIKAGSRVFRHAKFSLNKLNQEGGKNSWTRHMSEKKRQVEDQINQIRPFLEAAEAEADRRENEVEPVTQEEGRKMAEQFVATLEYPKDGEPTAKIDSLGGMDEPEEPELPSEHPGLTKDICGMFMDTNLGDILDLAKQGLEGVDDSGKVAALTEKVTGLEGNIEGLKKSYDELEKRQTKTYEEAKKLREENRELRKENKKLRNAAKEIKNMAARLKDFA